MKYPKLFLKTKQRELDTEEVFEIDVDKLCGIDLEGALHMNNGGTVAPAVSGKLRGKAIYLSMFYEWKVVEFAGMKYLIALDKEGK